MNLKLLCVKARCATIQVEMEAAMYENPIPYEIHLGDRVLSSSRVVETLFDLKPDTSYEAEIFVQGKGEGSLSFTTKPERITLNVKKMGAKGDGIQDDTPFIQAALVNCPEDSRVLIPAGTYNVRTLFLKSGCNLEIAKGATLKASTNPKDYAYLPGMVDSYDETESINLGTWEGNPLPMYCGILHAYEADNIHIYGEGVIDGCASETTWWHDVRNVSIFRPRCLFLSHCQNVTVQGLTFQNSPSWTIHPYFSKGCQFYNTKIINPKDSPNTDGLDPESCENVDIMGVTFDLGDDCIAIKSGKIFLAKKFETPSKHIHIEHCLMENGHGAITIGSEIAAGVEDIQVRKCVFKHTDRGLRIKTRRGRGERSILKDIHFTDVKMEEVCTPFVANSFYFCDPDGKSDYVQNQAPAIVDERTPSIDSLIFENVTATNAMYCAGYFHGLPEKKIHSVILRNVTVEMSPNATSGEVAMMCGLEPMKKAGFIFKNVEHVTLDQVSCKGQEGKVDTFENVDQVEGEITCK